MAVHLLEGRDKVMIGGALVLCFEILVSWINSKTHLLILHKINNAKKQIRFLGFVKDAEEMR